MFGRKNNTKQSNAAKSTAQAARITTNQTSSAAPQIKNTAKQVEKNKNDMTKESQRMPLSSSLASGFGKNPTSQVGYGRAAVPGIGQPHHTSSSGLQNPETSKKLVIAEGITIAGNINACEYLLVDVHVESNFKGSKQLEIAQTGIFKGTAETHSADIAGQFEGTLTVDGMLRVRPGGVVKGTIHYRELLVEAGAIVEGTFKTLTGEHTATAELV